jgi:hypothetical protein
VGKSIITGLLMDDLMKEKILFFTDGWFLNFGLAKYLQKKYDADLFAIFNFEDKAKEFFQNQNLVEFRKTWFFLDNLSNDLTEPDLKYLEEIEQKYNIDLWKIAYSDSIFYKYNKFHKFNPKEILCLIEQECKFFEKILDEIKPDFLSIYLTTSHYQELLSSICKVRGIKLLTLGPARFAKRMLISQEGLIIDNIHDKMQNASPSKRNSSELQDYFKKHDATQSIKSYSRKAFENNTIARYSVVLKFFFSLRSEKFYTRYYNFGRTRSKVFKTKISNFFNKRTRKNFIDKNLVKKIPKSKYVYFPLQSEPERVILLNSPFHTNQISIIQNIAKSLPIGYNLLVKEHPSMKILGPWRPISIYKEIQDLPNVVLIHPDVSNETAIKNSDLVITIAGTTGQEASFCRKPVITFTEQIYTSLPSVSILKNFEDLPNMIKNSLETKVNLDDLGKFIDIVEENTFPLDYIKMTTDFAFRFGFKGPIMDAKLSSSKIEKYIHDYEEQFEILSEEHLKKINEYRKNVE